MCTGYFRWWQDIHTSDILTIKPHLKITVNHERVREKITININICSQNRSTISLNEHFIF